MTSTNSDYATTHSDNPLKNTQSLSNTILEYHPLIAQTIIEELQRNISQEHFALQTMTSCLKRNPELIISNHLTRIGIPSGLSGYRYLVSAIQQVLEDESILDSITKILYPEIAKLHNSTPQRVEKAIRHAIKTTWDNTSQNHDEYHFFIRKGRSYPTNTQFIAEIYRKIRLSNVY